MKGFFNNIQTLLIVVLVVLLLLQRSCSSKPEPETKIVEKVTIKYDTVKVNTIVYQPKWRDRIITRVDTVPRIVDTAVILKDYYTKYAYSDTVIIDTLGTLVVNDTVTQNRIFSREIFTDFIYPTKLIERDIYKSENEWYAGFGLAGRPNQLNYLGGELLLRTKRKKVYGLGLGVNNELQPILTGRMFWKIGE